MNRPQRQRRVTRPANAVSDEIAARLLRISRMTLFRKLKDGTISAPALVEGTQRRWWRPPDIEVAREQLGSTRRERTS
jgi:excisionase family DNA binding protein